MHAIVCSELSQRFGAAWILAHVAFELPVGARLLLTGENGAGKTTLLRILATALRPSRGQLHLFGQSVWPYNKAVRGRLALLTHQHYFYEALSAQENLELVQRLAGPRAAGDVPGILAKVGLGAAQKAPVAAFSAGMKRRLALGRIMLLAPQLVLFDEPFAQLDPPGQAFVTQLIEDMSQSQTTLVIASHDIGKTRPLCTHHLHLAAGAPAPQLATLEPT